MTIWCCRGVCWQRVAMRPHNAPLFASCVRNTPAAASVWTAAGVSRVRCALVGFGVWEAVKTASSVLLVRGLRVGCG